MLACDINLVMFDKWYVSNALNGKILQISEFKWAFLDFAYLIFLHVNDNFRSTFWVNIQQHLRSICIATILIGIKA